MQQSQTCSNYRFLQTHPALYLNSHCRKLNLYVLLEFNLNLLQRINAELNANFEINNFDHYATYNPETGACKSYLISTQEQLVTIKNETIYFEKNEPVFMEVSQKYSISQIDEIAQQCGFHVLSHFFDKNHYFVDVILQCQD